MPKAHVIITAITVQGLSYRQVAAQYAVSKTWAHQLHKRWLAEGEAGLIPASKRPHTNPARINDDMRAKIIALRSQLITDGLDAGPQSIRHWLQNDGLPAPACSTISRIITAAGLVTPEPKKRPKSSYIRFEANGTAVGLVDSNSVRI